MAAYILRRLLLLIPTLLGVMVLNFVIINAAPGGPIEQVLARVKGTQVRATARFSGGGEGEVGGGKTSGLGGPGGDREVPRRARGSTRSSSSSSSTSSASTSRPGSASC